MKHYTIDEFSYMAELEKAKVKILKTDPKLLKKKPIEKIEKKERKQKKLKIIPCYMFDSNGELVAKFINPLQLANKYGWRYNTVHLFSEKEKVYNGYLLTMKYYEPEKAKEIYLSKTQPKPKKEKVVKEKKIRVKKEKPIKEKKPYIQLHPIYQYNSDGDLIASYLNGGDMAKQTGWKHNTIKAYSKKESVYNGFLITYTNYTNEQAKQRYSDVLASQQMTYIYKDGNLVGIFSTLSKVRDFINAKMTLKGISYHKERQKPIGDYLLSSHLLNS